MSIMRKDDPQSAVREAMKLGIRNEYTLAALNQIATSDELFSMLPFVPKPLGRRVVDAIKAFVAKLRRAKK